MKFQKTLLAAALAVVSTSSVYAVTADTSIHPNDEWVDPRGLELGDVDKSAYQYVDVGTGTLQKEIKIDITQNSLTSWYTVADEEYIKIETTNSEGKKEYSFYLPTNVVPTPEGIQNYLQNIENLDVVGKNDEVIDLGKDLVYTDKNGVEQTVSELSLQTYLEILTVPETDLKSKDYYDAGLIEAIKADYVTTQDQQLSGGLIPPHLGGVTQTNSTTTGNIALIKRLDSDYLEYAEKDVTVKVDSGLYGNLTDPITYNPEVWLTINTDDQLETKTEYDRGVINGIINTSKKGHLNDSDKYVKHFTNLFDEDATVTDNVYGLVASEVKTVSKIDPVTGKVIVEPVAEIDRYTAVTQAGVVVSDEIANTQTVITSEGITTAKLTVGGVDVGTALGNAAALGDLSKDQLDAIVTGGEKISVLETGLSSLDTKVTTEVARLDGRIDAELTANAAASTAYTDKKATETLAAADSAAKTGDAITLTAAQDFAKAEDVKTLAAADTAAKAGDAATLTSAKSYTDTQVAGFNTQITNVNSRVDQLNKRVSDVEKTSYRGIAIALAAQQQIPNIAAGQTAVFGGVGHYEGESAAALGLATVLADGRTSLSAALGVAGGSEVGGRVGVAYVFGGK